MFASWTEIPVLCFFTDSLIRLRIIWLGDLNYRINLSNVEAKALISKKQWSKLLEKDKVPQKLLLGNRTLQYHNFVSSVS
ncbi:putative inositol-polyphosphate 5-phosphatase [Medicago truncatula]|uniref:Putative inositol-polyphosphate 5-phosphatase n=1 Tax=Medicago truncatula TaxID=3880 RepID=A0A396HKY4_MEDTR|nr:putative inositol-polyphosphate 5-phosphatase [Medicago truncatula]